MTEHPVFVTMVRACCDAMDALEVDPVGNCRYPDCPRAACNQHLVVDGLTAALRAAREMGREMKPRECPIDMSKIERVDMRFLTRAFWEAGFDAAPDILGDIEGYDK